MEHFSVHVLRIIEVSFPIFYSHFYVGPYSSSKIYSTEKFNSANFNVYRWPYIFMTRRVVLNHLHLKQLAWRKLGQEISEMCPGRPGCYMKCQFLWVLRFALETLLSDLHRQQVVFGFNGFCLLQSHCELHNYLDFDRYLYFCLI